MPTLGDTPITSYFSRSTSSKRKTKAEESPCLDSDSAASKRRRSSLANDTSKPSKGTSTTGVKGREIGQLLQQQSPNTPLTKAQHKGKQSALPTPPATGAGANQAAVRRQRDVTPPVEPVTPMPLLISTGTSLPTPLTLKRTIPPHIRTPLATSTSSAIPSTSSRSDCIVPSSQSQAGEWDEPAPVPTFSVLAEKSTLLDISDMTTVASSQSQPLLVMIPSARKRPREVQAEPTFEIPTSQSQERELTIPDFLRTGQYSPSRSPRKSPRKSPLKQPHRTLSEELFPIPIRESLIEGIFDEDDCLADTEETPLERASLLQTQGSVTESEDEDVHHPNTSPAPVGHKQSPTRRQAFSQLSTSQDSRYSAISYTEASFSSLPDEVRAFRTMFGEDDESYPADFPESLK